MGAAILPAEGIADQLSYILSAPIVGVLPWTMILWVNDYEPTADTVLADLVEATWSGYARQTLTRGGWTTPTVDGDCCSSTWGTVPISLTATGPVFETNYGVAYVDYSTDVIRWVQRFDDEDIFPLSAGQVFKVLPRYTLTSAECSQSRLTAARARRRSRRR